MKKLSSMLALGLAAAMVFGMTVSAAESPNTATTITPSTTVDDSIVNSVVNASDELAGSQAVATQVAVSVPLPTLNEEEVKSYTQTAATQLAAVKAESITTNLKDDAGNPVAVTTKAVEPAVAAAAPQAAVEAVKQLVDTGILQMNTGSATTSSVTVKAGVDISLPADVAVSESNPVTVAIPVNIEIQPEKTYLVLHMVADGQWETVKAVIVNGTIYGTFTKLSPVLVVEADAVKAGNNDDDDDDDDSGIVVLENGTAAPASPKTGESIPVAGMMAVICLAGAAVCAVKVRYSR